MNDKHVTSDICLTKLFPKTKEREREDLVKSLVVLADRRLKIKEATVQKDIEV